MRKIIRGFFALLSVFLLLGGACSASTLEQKNYMGMFYSDLTNFDMDAFGEFYVIAAKGMDAELLHFNNEGTKLTSYPVIKGAAELNAAPSGKVIFYRVADSDKRGRVYRLSTADGSNSYKSGFTSGGSPVVIERVLGVDDDHILLIWHAEYRADAVYPAWLPQTVKIGLFRFSSPGEPENEWAWTPQWQGGESNFDNDPQAGRLGNSWGYKVTYNATIKRIIAYTTHSKKFYYEPTLRNHYSPFVTHVYTGSMGENVLTEKPRSALPGWQGEFEPYYSANGVLMYKKNDSYQGNVNFVTALYQADQNTGARFADKYVDRWTTDSGGIHLLSDTWKYLPWADVGLITNYFSDYQNNVYIIHGVRSLSDDQTEQLSFIRFASSKAVDPINPINPVDPVDPIEPDDPGQPGKPLFPGKDDVLDAKSPIKLRAAAYKPPKGYTHTGSKWEVWAKGSAPPQSVPRKSGVVFLKELNGAESECIVPAGTLSPGSYVWRMSYKWRNAMGAEGVTSWSPMLEFHVSSEGKNDITPSGGSSGGCSGGAGFSGLFLLIIWVISRRKILQ